MVKRVIAENAFCIVITSGYFPRVIANSSSSPCRYGSSFLDHPAMLQVYGFGSHYKTNKQIELGTLHEAQDIYFEMSWRPLVLRKGKIKFHISLKISGFSNIGLVFYLKQFVPTPMGQVPKPSAHHLHQHLLLLYSVLFPQPCTTFPPHFQKEASIFGPFPLLFFISSCPSMPHTHSIKENCFIIIILLQLVINVSEGICTDEITKFFLSQLVINVSKVTTC